MKIKQAECSETSAYKMQTAENNPKINTAGLNLLYDCSWKFL